MATTVTPTTPDDEPLTAADYAAIARALSETGIAITADELAQLLTAGGDDEVRDLIAVGRLDAALGLARFNIAEATYSWDEPRNRPLPEFDEPPW